MVRIDFLEDEESVQQVVTLLSDIVLTAKVDDVYKEFSHRITQAFDYLEEIGVPPKHLRTIQGESLEGFTITLADVVKELENHPPLLELRVNWPPVGAFRAIFFYEEDENGQSIFFTQAVIKQSTFSQDFEDAVINSEAIMKDFLNQSKKGDGLND